MTGRTLPLLTCILLLVSCGRSPSLEWKFKTEGRIYGAPAVAGARLIIAGADSFLYGVDLKSGQQVWKKKLGAPFFTGPVFYNGIVFVGAGNGDFLAVDPETGMDRWRIHTGSVIEYTPCADGDNLFFGNNRGDFYNVTTDGAVRWRKSFNAKFSGTCGVRNNLLYTSCWDKNFYALNPSGGDLVWKQPSGTLNFAGPMFQEDRVWFISHEHIFCFDPLSGALRFTRDTQYIYGIIEWKGSLWTTEKHRLCKRDHDGNLLGSLEFNSGVSPMAPLNNELIAGDRKNSLYGFTQDMKIVWTFKGGDAFTDGTLNAGMYYASNLDGNVYAIQLPQ